VAVNRRRKVQGQPEADFFRVDAWGKTAENCQQYLSKGRKVAVVGPVSVSTYQANDGSTRASLELHADDVEFLSSAGGGNAQAAEAAPAQEAEPQGNFVQVETDELPF
jgi:single-strand DNA-binding protein